MTRKLLLVIDFINDIMHPEGKMAGAAEYVAKNHVVKRANQAIAFARKNEIPIVHVKVGFSKDYIDCPLHSPFFGKAKKARALELGGWGTEFYSEMDVRETDTVIVKHRISALYATPLEAILRANRIDTVIISGVSTNRAVEAVTRELHDRDYHVVILRDACGAATKEMHESSLANMGQLAKVIKVADL